MSTYSLSHLADGVLLRDLAALVAQDRTTTAALLAHLAEVDARKLYLPAACPSMYDYCVRELGLSEQTALKRIRVARTAQQFPAIFAALADGRLNLNAVILLAPHLTAEAANELLAAAAHKTRSEIELLLAQRFPRPDLPARVEAMALSPAPGTGELLAPPVASDQLAPGRVESPGSQLSARTVAARPRVAPLSPERFALQLTMSKSTHDKLRHAQALLSHRLPSGDLAEVLDRALDALIAQLEKRKFAATDKPRPGRRSGNPRHIPADVKRRVWKRDGGQCTFVSDQGHRCPARSFIDFDHVNEVARGGAATTTGIRLLCWAHNQYGAERTFGTDFMNHKRQVARQKTEEARARVFEAEQTRKAAEARATAAAEWARAKSNEVIPWLRALGFRADEARTAAATCEAIPDAALEERVRLALRAHGRR